MHDYRPITAMLSKLLLVVDANTGRLNSETAQGAHTSRHSGKSGQLRAMNTMINSKVQIISQACQGRHHSNSSRSRGSTRVQYPERFQVRIECMQSVCETGRSQNSTNLFVVQSPPAYVSIT